MRVIIALDVASMLQTTVSNLIEAGDLMPGDEATRCYRALSNLSLDKLSQAFLQSFKARHSAFTERLEDSRN